MEERRKRSAALCTTLAVVVLVLMIKEGSNSTLPIAIPALQQLNGNAGGRFTSIIPGLGSTFYALGKLSVTVSTHAVGPRIVLAITCITNAIGMFMCAKQWLTVGWSLSQFSASQVWVACIGICSTWVDARHRGRTLGIVMGNGSDGGGILASLLFSLIFDAYGPAGWWLPFFISGMLIGRSLTLTFSVTLLHRRRAARRPDADAGPHRDPDPGREL